MASNICTKPSANFADAYARAQNVPQSLRATLSMHETFRKVCWCLCACTKRSAKFADDFAHARNLPQTLRKLLRSHKTINHKKNSRQLYGNNCRLFWFLWWVEIDSSSYLECLVCGNTEIDYSCWA